MKDTNKKRVIPVVPPEDRIRFQDHYGGPTQVTRKPEFYIVTVIWILGMFIFAWSFFSKYTDSKSPNIEVGQIWVSVDDRNPYEATKYDTMIVLDIEGDYALVNWNGYVTSWETSMISFRRTLVKNKTK